MSIYTVVGFYRSSAFIIPIKIIFSFSCIFLPRSFLKAPSWGSALEKHTQVTQVQSCTHHVTAP